MASSEQGEGDGDTDIVWETPDTPVNADDYIFKNGKRFVRPYFFEFVAHVKKRWRGKIIGDFFTDEFKGRPPEYYVQAIQSGRICVDGRRVAPSLVLCDGHKLSHFVHRHEPPVMAEPVKILDKGPDVLTVCKPASIPVHACGQYRKNTVIGILEAEHKTGQLFPIHRLDRLVSGLLILARNAQTANLFREEIEAGKVHKQYVAKVNGVFPADEVEVNAAVLYDPREGISTVATGQPGAGKGKESCTRFHRLSTDGLCSIVRCEPVTGRTHQIRVHLQHLGHPIGNDHLYLQAHPPKRSREGVYADTAAKSARTTRSNECSVLATTTMADGCNDDEIIGDSSTKSSSGRTKTGLEASLFKMSQERASDYLSEGKEESFPVDRMCTHCPNLGPSGYENDEDGLWLHCVRYASPSWAYECPLPNWALCSPVHELGAFWLSSEDPHAMPGANLEIASWAVPLQVELH